VNPRDDDDNTEDIEPNTDWRTAEIPMDTGKMAELLRTTPRPCPVCREGSFIYLKQHGELFHRMGLGIGTDVEIRCEVMVCRRCGRVDWFVVKPEALLEDPDYAATVIESKS
jgi:hypothetical protein